MQKTTCDECLVGVYKPGKAPGLWKYFVFRYRRRPGTFAIKEYLTPSGTWSEFSFNLKYYSSEEAAKKAIEDWRKNVIPSKE